MYKIECVNACIYCYHYVNSSENNNNSEKILIEIYNYLNVTSLLKSVQNQLFYIFPGIRAYNKLSVAVVSILVSRLSFK